MSFVQMNKVCLITVLVCVIWCWRSSVRYFAVARGVDTTSAVYLQPESAMHVGGVVLNAPVMYSVITMILTLSCCVDVFSINTEEYLHKRQQLISSEYQMRTGAGMTLSDAERRVNARLMNLKAEELKIARENVTNFPPAVHFFRAKALIDDSQVFKVIRTMPKGKIPACLAVHTANSPRPHVKYTCTLSYRRLKTLATWH